MGALSFLSSMLAGKTAGCKYCIRKYFKRWGAFRYTEILHYKKQKCGSSSMFLSVQLPTPIPGKFQATLPSVSSLMAPSTAFTQWITNMGIQTSLLHKVSKPLSPFLFFLFFFVLLLLLLPLLIERR